MRLHIWSEHYSASNGGSYLFSCLRLYDDAGVAYSLTALDTASLTECRFSVKDRNEIVKVTCSSPYGGTYYVAGIIKGSLTQTGAAYSFYLKNQTALPVEEQGIYIDIPDSLKISKISFIASNGHMYDYCLQIDNFKTPIQRGNNGTGTVANNFTLSNKTITFSIPIKTTVKGIRGKDGKLYFLKPKDKR